MHRAQLVPATELVQTARWQQQFSRTSPRRTRAASGLHRTRSPNRMHVKAKHRTVALHHVLASDKEHNENPTPHIRLWEQGFSSISTDRGLRFAEFGYLIEKRTLMKETYWRSLVSNKDSVWKGSTHLWTVQTAILAIDSDSEGFLKKQMWTSRRQCDRQMEQLWPRRRFLKANFSYWKRIWEAVTCF